MQRRLALRCRVVRDGHEQTLSVSQVVPGDVILLSAGNLVPADAILMEATDFLVNEASLTGESFPVEKSPGEIPPTNPLDAALVSAGEAGGLTTTGYRKIDEIPCDFRRKQLTIVVAEEGDFAHHTIVTKGAFSNVLHVCSSMSGAGGDISLTADLGLGLDAFYRAKGDEGFRLQAVATRKVAPKDHHNRDDETGMAFAGFLPFSNPPKPEAQRTIRDLTNLGIRIKIISGDNRHVTAHLARAVGVDATPMLTGDELARLKDEALWHLASRTGLFVEVDPQQKERIVRALLRVAMRSATWVMASTTRRRSTPWTSASRSSRQLMSPARALILSF